MQLQEQSIIEVNPDIAPSAQQVNLFQQLQGNNIMEVNPDIVSGQPITAGARK
jgi:hypothetical protein